MASNNLGLSTMATGQLERMIDDAAWLTYPLHLAVGIIKDFVYALFLISAVILAVGVWMFTAHDNRADLIAKFPVEQTIYQVNPATNAIAVQRAGTDFVVDKDIFNAVFNGCMGEGTQLKNPLYTDRHWLAEKSDLFQSAYIASSRNLAALTYALHEAKLGKEVASFHYACSGSKGWTTPVVIPNTPVVYVAYQHQTDESIMDSANAQWDWFTGLCLVGANCTQADFMPRNDNIYADAISPQVTANQAAALKALNATGIAKFWIAAAHANGIADQDAAFANYAAMQRVQLAKDMNHPVTEHEAWMRTVEIAIVGFILFIGFIGWWIIHRWRKAVREREENEPRRRPENVIAMRPTTKMWPA
jgi:hypothetical protein